MLFETDTDLVKLSPRPNETESRSEKKRKQRTLQYRAPENPVEPLPPSACEAWCFLVSVLLALSLAIVAIPVVLVAAIIVRLTSRGPAFYSQTRVGRYGKLFKIHKLRTMIHECESLTGPRWSTPGDPRITPVGQVLRRTHIDELPQLLNVLRGEMSLVGPRPERPEFVPHLRKMIPHYCDRLAVRPGVTGLAQLQLPPDTDLAGVRRKLALDLHYIQNLSPWLDLRIVLCTALSAVGLPFSLSGKLLGIPGRDAIDLLGEGGMSKVTVMTGQRLSA